MRKDIQQRVIVRGERLTETTKMLIFARCHAYTLKGQVKKM